MAAKIQVCQVATPAQWKAIVQALGGLQAPGAAGIFARYIASTVLSSLKETRRLKLQERSPLADAEAKLAKIDLDVAEIDSELNIFPDPG